MTTEASLTVPRWAYLAFAFAAASLAVVVAVLAGDPAAGMLTVGLLGISLAVAMLVMDLVDMQPAEGGLTAPERVTVRRGIWPTVTLLVVTAVLAAIIESVLPLLLPTATSAGTGGAAVLFTLGPHGNATPPPPTEVEV